MATGASFTYVLIPADGDLPFKEFAAVAVECGDTLKELLKDHFAGGRLSNLDELRAQYGDTVDQRKDMLQQVADRGSVEMMPLVRSSKTTLPLPDTATFLYYDEMGALKDRPDNLRAFELAKQCGLDLEHPLPGDVFVGRVCCDPGPISVSIGMHELDSSVPWIRQAPVENAAWKDVLSDLKSAEKTRAPQDRTAAEEQADADGKGWRWSQSETEVEVTVVIPEGTTKNTMVVAIGRLSLRVALRSDPAKTLVELRLYAPVVPDDSVWTLGQDASGPHVQVTLAKEEEEKTWPVIEAKGR
mmetsp:Transcript_83056/g.164745  ORF Transcript_83056/g.164745 Transcript_83056/m.164745 type:complete len:300 (-) Transcript_83056:37-936(-)|eukprot:CAMPEP_0172866868 /NCGR_PEP_ID=MMETSP1075-20121228/82230_1 /TAXON_ID=2916 /ORGANISM="Ceratium fusus, Strain PA161109" /LENGTH=299 /DNA_ID=CAMNT_0013716079 /DNA_START=27 /DNA_END=926 /DNA_ORIENTATION=+